MEKRMQTRAFANGTCTAGWELDVWKSCEFKVLNLGVGGCCLELTEPLDLAKGMAYLSLIHSDLPTILVRSESVWQQEAIGGGHGTMHCGIRFLDLPPGYEMQLASTVNGLARAHVRGNEWIISHLQLVSS